jgi:hypothetical protein
MGEQLGQAWLGAMDAEATLQLPDLIRTEGGGIEAICRRKDTAQRRKARGAPLAETEAQQQGQGEQALQAFRWLHNAGKPMKLGAALPISPCAEPACRELQDCY